MKNGSEASYVVGPGIGFNLLVFERDGWQYVLSIDSDVGDKETPEVLFKSPIRLIILQKLRRTSTI